MPGRVIQNDEREVDYYRAKFRQLKDNPLGIRVPYIVSVDVVRATKNTWKAVESTGRATFREVKRGTSSDAKYCVAGLFEEQISEWVAHDKNGNPVEPKTSGFSGSF